MILKKPESARALDDAGDLLFGLAVCSVLDQEEPALGRDCRAFAGRVPDRHESKTRVESDRPDSCSIGDRRMCSRVCRSRSSAVPDDDEPELRATLIAVLLGQGRRSTVVPSRR